MSALPVIRDSRGRAMGLYERLCWERHEKDLALANQEGGHPRGFIFSEERAERVVKFVEDYCRHYKGEWAGTALLLEEWQRRIIRIIFGWYKSNGTRRFRVAYVEIARKNGKSLLAAALGLYLLIADGEEGAEIWASATKLDQAKIVWSDAKQMVLRSPELKKHVRTYEKSLVNGRTTSTFKPLGSTDETLDGLNPHGNIVDELHAHEDRGLWDVLQSAMGARRQPLTVAITTAGHLDTESIGYEQHEYAQRVLTEEYDDDEYFAFIAAAEDGDDYFGDLALEKANPNIDISAKRDYLRKQGERAKRLPSSMSEYLKKHLNVWTQQSKGWIPLDEWKACEPKPVSLAEREEEFAGMVCNAGLDLSEKIDLSALVLEFHLTSCLGCERLHAPAPLCPHCGRADGAQAGGYFAQICRFWLPELRCREFINKGQRFFEQWVRDGFLTLTPGNVVDHEFIQKEVLKLSKMYRIRELAFDPWKATQTATKLTGEGIQMVECRQGFKTFAEPVNDVEASVKQGRLKHGNNPILRWNVANAVVVSDAAGNKKLDKSKAKGRIDGAVAMLMARSRMVTAQPPPPNPYNGPNARGFSRL